MNLSNNGRIIIIDDRHDEAIPLINFLYNKGLPCVYYTGDQDKLPENSLTGVRFVFLDVVLDGLEGSEEITPENISLYLISILIKIIDKNNGPYFIIFWTKHEDIINKVLQYCDKAEIPPTSYISLDKKKYYGDNYENLADDIDNLLMSNKSFLTLVQWENIAHNAISEFFFNFSKLIYDNENWSNNVKYLLNKLAETELGQQPANDNERLKAAFSLINRGYYDVLQTQTSNDIGCSEGFWDNIPQLAADDTIKTIAKLNNWLSIDSSITDIAKTGSVYKIRKDKTINSIIDYFKINNNELKDCSPICVVLTAECDIAQRKNLKICINTQHDTKDNNLHRIIKGIIVPYDTKIKQDGYAPIILGPFSIEEKPVKLCFHLSAISLQPEKKLGKYIFCLSSLLVHDIQTKAANYLNRIGNIIINPDYKSSN